MVRYVIETAPGQGDLEVLCRIERVVRVTRHGLRASATKQPIALRLRGEVVALRRCDPWPSDRRAIAESFGPTSA